jgi:hypothetical protein
VKAIGFNPVAAGRTRHSSFVSALEGIKMENYKAPSPSLLRIVACIVFIFLFGCANVVFFPK